MKTHLGPSRLPILLLAATIVLVSIADWLLDFTSAMMVPLLVEEGWDRLKAGEISWKSLWPLITMVTHAFLHSGPQHLLWNMLLFWIFGSVILEICGWRWMLAIFIITAVGGALGQMMIDRGGMIFMLGASGTVMGFQGAYLGLVVQKARPNPFVWPMASPIAPSHLAAFGVIAILMDMMGVLRQSPGDQIAYGAHIGGFVSGIFVSFFHKG